MKKNFIFLLLLLAISVIVVYSFFFAKEVDDVAENGPIQSEIVSVTNTVPLFEGVLAAGISWDYEQDRFFISTDEPHSLLTKNIASFYVVNAALNQIEYKKELKVDGDLEGIAYIGNAEVAIISELGTIYYLKEREDEWEETHKVSVFDGDEKHKLGSLAYDASNKLLYSAEKEGEKIIYQISRRGELLERFAFDIGTIEAKREFDIDKDYTIAGMAYSNQNQHLYLFSEAYSTIFKYHPETKQLSAVFGVNNIHESAGITLKRGEAYLVGDFESYLPSPNIYRVSLPD